MDHTSRPLEVSASSTTMVKKTLVNLMQGLMKLSKYVNVKDERAQDKCNHQNAPGNMDQCPNQNDKDKLMTLKMLLKTLKMLVIDPKLIT